jgi:CubicO group peptidase (beta-lactamase class C family)
LRVSSGAAWLERFDGEAAPEDISANGLIIDDVLYLRGCETRYGPYPYCREMRHGVFSVTKSLGAAIALLRLAQKYGDQVFELKIKNFLTVTASHDGWERVTFRDALNMATGIGDVAPQRKPPAALRRP